MTVDAATFDELTVGKVIVDEATVDEATVDGGTVDAATAGDERLPHLSLVVPVYNGGTRLERNLAAIREFVRCQPYSAELLIVDDHSTDETPHVLSRFADATPGVRVLRNARNVGKGYSVARGMLAARGEYRVFTDADLAYPPDQVTRVLADLESGADIAVACRVLPDSRYVMSPTFFSYLYTRHIASRAFNALVRRTLVPGILDTQAGLKGFTAASARQIFDRVSTPGFGFDIEVLYLARRLGFVVAQTAVTFRYEDEPTTMRFVRDGARMAHDVLRIRRRTRAGAYD